MLLRSPEIATTVADSVFSAVQVRSDYAAEDRGAFGKHLLGMQTALSSALRSTDENTRSNTLQLLRTLLDKADEASIAAFGKEIISGVKTGKFASAHAKLAALQALAFLPPSTADSPAVCECIFALVEKEQAEGSCRTGLQAAFPHISHLLDQDKFEGVKPAASALNKLLQHAKPPVRHAANDITGTEIFGRAPQSKETVTDAWKSFLEALLPALKAGLENASQGTKAPAGPLEGYVAAALLVGRFRSLEIPAATSLATSELVRQLSASAGSTKPSFILNDKVVRKLSTDTERIWLLDALGALLDAESATIGNDEDSLAVIASALSQFARSSSGPVRRKASQWIESVSNTSLALGSQIARAAVIGALQASENTASGPTASSDDAVPSNSAASIGPRMRATLSSVASAASKDSDRFDTSEKEAVLLRFFILAHHKSIAYPITSLASALGVELPGFLERYFTRLLADIHIASHDERQADAAFDALATASAAAPDVVLPEVVGEIERELSLDKLQAVTSQDIQIWETPAGTLCVDILAEQKAKQEAQKTGRESKMDKWDAEVRESIAKKRAAAGVKTYTKEEQKLIDQQLVVESDIRQKIDSLRKILLRSLRTVQALVIGRSDETPSYVFGLVQQALHLTSAPAVESLVPFLPFHIIQELAKLASARLQGVEGVLASALLRCKSETHVPEAFRFEPLAECMLRILYKARFVSERTPLDLATISLLAPLVADVVANGGIAVDESDRDAVMEQIQLCLDLIVHHAGACEDARYPRNTFIDALLTIVARHTQLAKEAVSALREVGEGMKGSALPAEINKLLSHAIADAVYVRSGSLQALQSQDLSNLSTPYQLWIATQDSDEENARLALKAWQENSLDLPASYGEGLITYLEHPGDFPRLVTPRAIAIAADSYPETVSNLLVRLIELYRERNKLLLPEYDQYGMVIEGTDNRKDPWEIRVAIASTFNELAEYFSRTDMSPFFTFLIEEEALGDRHEAVRLKILEAATTVIDEHGAEYLDMLIAMTEKFFARSTQAGDGVTEAVVILLGRLARHLQPQDPRLTSTIQRLIEALHTPSEMVQAAVADCLPPLILATPKATPRLIDELMDELVAGEKYAHRRGAAYGLAGVIRGHGIASFSEYKIMERLADAARDKDKMTARQGAMFAYETLTASLTTLFEPYIHGILPQLLACFGDPKEDVREATQDASRVIMNNISGHCLKGILPTLLAGLDDKQWRSKKGAVELLGAMAYCAPRQLSVSLPKVIPPLSEVLSDSHNQVKAAANKSLKQFGEVIDNPEIKKLTNKLLQALINPNDNIGKALTALLNTSFVHYIDSASLALVSPIVERGLKERSAGLQRDAARIVGNLAGLTDSRDFVPYLRTMVPLVRTVLVSPVPEARAVAAKALGTLVERLGEANFVDLVPSLLEVLRSDATGVDRQGSAQGLAEILAGLGTERMEGLLPEIISNASNARAYVRAGYISLLIYLPATFGHRFAPHLGRIISPILGGIADSQESVREASMRAGRMIIANYSAKAVDLLLPELERGLFDEHWRIRMSSVQLVADLLFRLSGISGKNEMEENEGDDAEVDMDDGSPMANNSIHRALSEALGEERRDRVLAAIYIVRQDPNVPVRQAAIHTWKALVLNTPRTAREILPTMLDILIRILASPGVEQQEIAGRTLGELVRKLGERILRETIPILRNKGVTGEDAQTRAGVCLAVTEILQSATKSESSIFARAGDLIAHFALPLQANWKITKIQSLHSSGMLSWTSLRPSAGLQRVRSTRRRRPSARRRSTRRFRHCSKPCPIPKTLVRRLRWRRSARSCALVQTWSSPSWCQP